ncbi:hypothetical protein TIFTF001_040320 [Ficus carica]|uniref:Protein kinase domain-containing protein n=1 Tax=Ficus carica TaxID=3494 RepID=A0AA88CMU2_FICCA|nr:hypothetical protein TIFTF001_040309 [Ficus carica]GMN22680.1 hypothetical protein TIFTF001_040312 [Ficus carica]GMN22692.1 hypothetical protein TIFTF001_040317 [Ficus carica]GMN22706.1 hypothetical protein TIFTF001_040320 [Ficus carica]
METAPSAALSLASPRSEYNVTKTTESSQSYRMSPSRKHQVAGNSSVASGAGASACSVGTLAHPAPTFDRSVNTGVVRCWRGRASGNDHDHDGRFPSPGEAWKFSKITCGSGFACGVLKNGSRVKCWGNRGVEIGAEIQSGFGNLSMLSLVAGESHACGLATNGSLVCKGNNNSGQLDVPNSSAFVYNEFSGLALGANFTCAIRERNGLVSCWGDEDRFQSYVDVIGNVSFEFIVAGFDFACGLTTSNLSVICWGPGWSNSKQTHGLPIGMVIPGQCVESPCGNCGTYPDSETLCHGLGHICKLCQSELPFAAPLPPIGDTTTSPSQHVSISSIAERKLLLAFLIVGFGGSLIGFCSIVYCLWTGIIHRFLNRTTEPNTVYESNLDVDAKSGLNSSNGVQSPGKIPLEAYSQTVDRQRSGASKPETFSLSELVSATDNFSSDNVIGSGSFGIVYKGKLVDGREVAIKRGRLQTITSVTTKTTKKNFQEKDSAFDSELALLSRLHHKHLVSLVGFCEENDERFLVYDYMTNGSLHNHLHDKNNNAEKSSSVLNSWTMRIKIALDAARGIEYLHNYAVPPIIHRDIKSSNILLDSTWTGKVSDFGLSLVGPELGQHVPTTKAVGTVGYIDPEYYVLNVLTTKSDVYGLGVVMLELLTGKKAVFKSGDDRIGVSSIVEYAGRGLLLERGEVVTKVLDERVGVPEVNEGEAEAVEVFTHTAMSCVRLEGKERPGMADVVANLERAFLLCQDSFSSATFS